MFSRYSIIEEYNHVPFYEYFSERIPYALILTCCVYINSNKAVLAQTNYQERIDTYLKSIHNWLEKTNLPIVVVENSGYTFPEINRNLYKNRLEIISFQEENKKKYRKFHHF